MTMVKEEIRFKEVKRKLNRDELIEEYSRLDEYNKLKEDKEK